MVCQGWLKLWLSRYCTRGGTSEVWLSRMPAPGTEFSRHSKSLCPVSSPSDDENDRPNPRHSTPYSLISHFKPCRTAFISSDCGSYLDEEQGRVESLLSASTSCHHDKLKKKVHLANRMLSMSCPYK